MNERGRACDENFDAIGRWREKDESNQTIAAAATLPDGTTVNGPDELKKLLLARKDDFTRGLADKLPTHALPGQISAFHIEVLAIAPEAVFRSGELPPVHGDPFDRLLAAQALIGPFKFLTPDPPFRAYGVDCIW
ncbi:MAG: hypothetical protein QOE70_87 [Chthoniobacter sp.]|nr:hypothetical protein [Chthoniobacter sp.]